MVICLERGADLHMAQLTPLPLTVSCFSKIQIGFTFLVTAHPGSPRKRAVKRVCVQYNTGLSKDAKELVVKCYKYTTAKKYILDHMATHGTRSMVGVSVCGHTAKWLN